MVIRGKTNSILALGLSLLFTMFTPLGGSSLSWAEERCEACQSFKLEELLEIALKDNTSVQISQASIKRLEGKLLAARSNFFPDLIVDAELGFNNINDALDSTEYSTENWEVSLLANQKLYTGGRNSSTLKKAKALKKAEKLRLESVKNEISFQIRERFIRHIAFKQKIERNISLSKIIKRELSKEKLRNKLGKSPEVFLLRLELALQKLRSEIVSQQELASSLKRQVLEIVGLEYDFGKLDHSKINFIGKLSNSTSTLEIRKLFAEAQKNRIEIERFNKLIEAAEHEEGALNSKLLPDVSLFAGYEIEKENDFNNLEDKGNWKAGISINWKIFDSQETKGLVDAAKAETKIRKLQKRELLLKMGREVRKAYDLSLEARNLATNSFKIEEKAKKVLGQVEARYSVGRATQIELLEAQIGLNEASKLTIDSIYRAEISKAYILKSLGKSAHWMGINQINKTASR